MKSTLTVSALVCAMACVTPLLRRDAWWIRVFDFPRLQILILGLLVLAAFLFVWDLSSLFEGSVVAALAAALLFQGSKIVPYSPLVTTQVRQTSQATPHSSVSLLIGNVLMRNRQVERFIALVQEADPDILFILEPDEWWEEQLRVLESVYVHTVKHPLSNRYGLLLYSKLRLIKPEIKFLIKKDIPSVHTQVQLPSGDRVWLHGLHPEPPAPTEAATSTKRDAELLSVGKEIKNQTQPVIVAGDLNDVAWSYTTSLFQKTSGLLDPRIGRGMFNTFHANIPLLRWPLDHVFHSDHFLLVSMQRLPAFGSDHFPVYIQLSHEARAPRLQETPEDLQAEEKALVEEKIDKVDQREEL